MFDTLLDFKFSLNTSVPRRGCSKWEEKHRLQQDRKTQDRKSTCSQKEQDATNWTRDWPFERSINFRSKLRTIPSKKQGLLVKHNFFLIKAKCCKFWFILWITLHFCNSFYWCNMNASTHKTIKSLFYGHLIIDITFTCDSWPMDEIRQSWVINRIFDQAFLRKCFSPGKLRWQTLPIKTLGHGESPSLPKRLYTVGDVSSYTLIFIKQPILAEARCSYNILRI